MERVRDGMRGKGRGVCEVKACEEGEFGKQEEKKGGAGLIDEAESRKNKK